MKLRLDHIGLAAEGIGQMADLFRALGLDEITEPVPDPAQKVSASFVPANQAGDVYIEILEPTRDDSPISKFVKQRGGGLHHLCFETDDIDAALRTLEARGFTVVSPPVDCPAYDTNLGRQCAGTTRIAFFLLSDKILIELIEKGR